MNGKEMVVEIEKLSKAGCSKDEIFAIIMSQLDN